MDKRQVLLKFIIPGHPPSVNRVWRNVGRAKFIKSNEYQKWESMVRKVCLTHPERARAPLLVGSCFRLSITVVSETWLTKDKRGIKMPDTPNMIKSAEDAICACYGWNDRFNIETNIKKSTQEGSEDYTIVEFTFV